MSENLQFPIPNNVLEPYIKQAVSSAIIGALGDGTKLVELAVASALNTKVSSSGSVSNYSSDNRYSIAEVIARNKIIEITKTLVTEMVEQMRPDIEKEIRKQISNSKSEIAKAVIDGLLDSIKCSYNVKVSFRGE